MTIMKKVADKLQEMQDEMIYYDGDSKKEAFKKTAKGLGAAALEGAFDVIIITGIIETCIQIGCICTGHKVFIDIIPKE